MKQDILNERHWLSDEGKIIVRKDRDENEEVVGSESIWLGNFDNIDNYEELEKARSVEYGN